jgi:hypothetical protein
LGRRIVGAQHHIRMGLLGRTPTADLVFPPSSLALRLVAEIAARQSHGTVAALRMKAFAHTSKQGFDSLQHSGKAFNLPRQRRSP